MKRPLIKIVDVVSKQEEMREMTDEEYAQYLIDIAADEARMAEKVLENASE